MRDRIFSRVLLPAPLRPMMPTTSPGRTSKSTSFKAQNLRGEPRGAQQQAARPLRQALRQRAIFRLLRRGCGSVSGDRRGLMDAFRPLGDAAVTGGGVNLSRQFWGSQKPCRGRRPGRIGPKVPSGRPRDGPLPRGEAELTAPVPRTLTNVNAGEGVFFPGTKWACERVVTVLFSPTPTAVGPFYEANYSMENGPATR